MPDLSHYTSLNYWKDYPDPNIYRVLVFLEAVEDWTPDGDPNLEAALTQLGKELDDLEKIKLSEANHEETFVRICANVKSSRALRLLQAIDTQQAGSASKVLMYAEEKTQAPDDPAGIFLKRNVAFERLRLLSRVFSKQRVTFIQKVLEQKSS